MPDRVALTRKQSVIRYGNPYGDWANEFMRLLNAVWCARKVIDVARYPEETVALDKDLKKAVEFLREHEAARPWIFNQFTGYAFKDLSDSAWEGHWSSF